MKGGGWCKPSPPPKTHDFAKYMYIYICVCNYNKHPVGYSILLCMLNNENIKSSRIPLSQSIYMAKTWSKKSIPACRAKYNADI